MLYKKSPLGKRYIKLMTGSPLPFLSFILLGTSLFLFLTLTIKLDVKKTYSAVALKNNNGIMLKTKNLPSGKAYLYTNRNEEVYPVLIKRLKKSDKYHVFAVDTTQKNSINSLKNKKVFIDVSEKKETLLYRIFVRGGKNYE